LSDAGVNKLHLWKTEKSLMVCWLQTYIALSCLKCSLFQKSDQVF